ncbi:hypothetical protein BH11PSE11_BH11PSE11_24410 [soil metagenome]
MTNSAISLKSNYDPDNLLDALRKNLGAKNDAALSSALAVAPPIISKIRHHRLPVSGSILIRMHEVTNLSISELRNLMGDRRKKFRMSASHRKQPTEIGAQSAQPQSAQQA